MQQRSAQSAQGTAKPPSGAQPTGPPKGGPLHSVSAGHAMPQAPQLALSAGMHAPSQQTSAQAKMPPRAQGAPVVSEPQRQMPPPQTSPAAQTLPAMPQFISSVVKSTQVAAAPPPTHDVGAAQLPPVPPQAHIPSVHVSFIAQALPMRPQLASSVRKSMHPRDPIALIPQRRSPVQAALVPQRQPVAPQRSAVSVLQAIPQPRQFKNEGSEDVVPDRFTQVAPQHCWLALQLGEQAPMTTPESRGTVLASTRTPVSVGIATGMQRWPTHSSPDAHRIPHPPQLAASLNVLRQVPEQHVCTLEHDGLQLSSGSLLGQPPSIATRPRLSVTSKLIGENETVFGKNDGMGFLGCTQRRRLTMGRTPKRRPMPAQPSRMRKRELQSIANTASTCPATFTFENTCFTTPSGVITNVVRTIPRDFFP